MPHHPVIRPIQATDLPTLQCISAEARDRYRAIATLAHVAASPPVDLERFRAGTGWVAELDGQILGHALTRRVDDLLFLDNISTRPGTRGAGLGALLLVRVLNGAAEAGFDRVALTTFRVPAWNGPWFRRFGFLPVAAEDIGPELAGILRAQAAHLDPDQRETLSRRVSMADPLPTRLR